MSSNKSKSSLVKYPLKYNILLKTNYAEHFNQREPTVYSLMEMGILSTGYNELVYVANPTVSNIIIIIMLKTSSPLPMLTYLFCRLTHVLLI